MVKYEAFVNGLHITVDLGVKRLDVRGDSTLIIDQVMKESSCHDPEMDAYCNTLGVKHALSLSKTFISILIKHSIT